ARLLRALARVDERHLGPFAAGDVARDGPMRGGAVAAAQGKLGPRGPTQAARRVNGDIRCTEIFAAREAIRHGRNFYAELAEFFARKLLRLHLQQISENAVRIKDAAVTVAVHDKIAQRLQKIVEALLAFLHLPHAV